jgi:hypothetical protein
MTSSASQPDGAPEPLPGHLDLQRPEEVQRAVAEVSMRLLAGAVDRRTLETLKSSVQAATGEYPWQLVTRTVLAQKADEQKVVQSALVAQRDWVLRGGRETPRSLSMATKGLVARLVAQLIIFTVTAAVVVAALLLLKYRYPEFDIYRILTAIQDLLGKLKGG